jgi:hypothetical protein
MKKLAVLFLFLVSLYLSAQNTLEIAPGVRPVPPSFTEDSFNLHYSFPTIAFIGEYGAETDGSTVYATQWLGDSLASYDFNGNTIEKFTIYGVERVRDLAFDGQYYYGSPNEYYFYVLDLDNKIAIDTIYTSIKIRGMAYDPAEDVLWVSEHWQPSFYKMDKQGNILDSWIPSGITMDAISGLAYDNTSPYGPFLWGFSQDSSGAVIVKYDINNQTQTGNMIDVASLAPEMSVAGGLYLEEIDGTTVIGGVIQNQLHFALTLDYANTLVGLEEKDRVISLLEVYPNPARNVLNIKTDLQHTDRFHIHIINHLGLLEKEITSGMNENGILNIDISGLEGGIYFMQINSQGHSITSKFVKQN